jgi:hypothetical protein
MGVMDVIILDVTRMQENRVCLAGVHGDARSGYRNVRPVPPVSNLTVDFLRTRGGEFIEPFKVVRFTFYRKIENPPHIEDMAFLTRMSEPAKVIRELNGMERRKLLESIAVGSPRDIFGENLVANRFIYENTAGRSLGCLAARKVDGPVLRMKPDGGNGEKLEIRLEVTTGTRKSSYPVVERALHSHVKERLAHGTELQAIESDLRGRLSASPQVHLRMGLTRPYRSPTCTDSDPRRKCYVQILGIHSFPALMA